MDNAGVVASSLNELNVLESLREQRAPYIRQAGAPAAPPEQVVDVVEFSRQSLQLSRAVTNPPEQRVNPPQEGDTTVSEERYRQTENGIAANTPDTTNITNEPTGTNGVPDNQPLTLFEEQAYPIPNPQEDTRSTLTENQDLFQRLDSTIEAYTAAAPAAVPATTTGTVANETGSVQRIENPTVTSSPLEAQANELSRVNEILTNSNGVPGNSPVTNADQTTQVAQYQEQVLLQTVGTQLAQAVPPSSIFSLLA